MRLRRAQPTEAQEVRWWIADRHYTRTAPPGYRFALEFHDPGGRRIGAMLLGRPTSREIDPELWLELTRMYFIDDTEKNTESRALAMMRRWVRVWVPNVKGLLAYSDPGAGHEGTVYRADGWAPFGWTDARVKAWLNRPGRQDGHSGSRKVRWVRTP